MTSRLLGLLVSLACLPASAAAAAAFQQDCNLNGVPDAQENYPPPTLIATDDFLSVPTFDIDVLANDNYWGGHCLGGVCIDCSQATNCGNDTVHIITGPQHGSASFNSNSHVSFNFSNYQTHCGDYEYITYYWQDQCGLKSNTAVVRIPTVCSGPNEALSVDGSGWVRVPDTGQGSSVDLTSPFTIEAWIKPTSVTTLGTIVAKWGDDGINDRSYLVEAWLDGSIYFGVSDDAHQQDTSYHDFRSGQLTPNVWQHIACTYDGAYRRTFLNGVLVGIKATQGQVHSGDTDVSIGAHLGKGNSSTSDGQINQHFVGLIDRVRIWSIALRADQIQLSMNIRYVDNAQQPNQGPAPITALEFDSGFNDSFNVNDGTAVGTASLVSATDIPHTMIDCDGNGLPDYYDIFYYPSLDLNQDGVLDSCQYSNLCFGDGSATQCPCANNGSLGNGCANSANPNGAHLAASGEPSVYLDSILLTASGMPSTVPALFFQTTNVINGGSGTTQGGFGGDGLLCLTGTLIRLGTLVAAGGTAAYPSTGFPPVSVKGMVLPGSTRYYHVRYRNATNFCTPALYNTTNATVVHWTL
jgi:hypothetical protein